MLFGNGLRKLRDGLRGQGEVARRLGDALPALDAAEAESRQVREHGKRHDGVDHLLVAVEHGFKIPPYFRLLRYLLEEPDVPVQAVLPIAAKDGTPLPAPVGQLVQQAQVPVGGEYEFRPLAGGKSQELGPWRELAAVKHPVVLVPPDVLPVLPCNGALDAGVDMAVRGMGGQGGRPWLG